MRYGHLLNTQALHGHVMAQAERPEGNIYLFFDAIQEVQYCEKCINSFQMVPDRNIYITGSNANPLSGELSTYLGGRYVEFVSPLLLRGVHGAIPHRRAGGHRNHYELSEVLRRYVSRSPTALADYYYQASIH